jgi:tRNA (guanine37-N1)-methyltransferase
MNRRPPLRINILTLFPDLVQAAFSQSILKRAVEKKLFAPGVVNIRDYARDRHHTADDKPYGGGSGMVMKVEPIHRALAALKKRRALGKVYLLAPTGKPFNQALAARLARTRAFTLICGRYEGVDERVSQKLCDGEISVGDFVLSGGEPAAVIVADAVVRLIPGVLGDGQSALFDSFSDGLLDYPHYTRPEKYRAWTVPPELLSGDHQRVAEWRRRQQLARTRLKRPDLLPKAPLNEADRAVLAELQKTPRAGRRHRTARQAVRRKAPV